MPLARPDARSSAALAISGFRAHDVGDAEPLLVAIFRLDDARRHDTAADTHRPSACVIDGAIPFGAVVDDDQTFRLVALFVTSLRLLMHVPRAHSAKADIGFATRIRALVELASCCHARGRADKTNSLTKLNSVYLKMHEAMPGVIRTWPLSIDDGFTSCG